jgi:2-oxoglutarate dehydrogenase E2 component (dihydrolipoamide succinyltransferase)
LQTSQKLTVGRWFERVGDAVSIDEPLVEIDTDNLTHELRAPVIGVLAKTFEGRRICRTRHFVGRLIRSDRADPGADAAASPPAVELEPKAKEMTNALSDGISALVDSCWSRLGGARDCRRCISEKQR